MAEQKISELPNATPLDGTEQLPLNQNGVTSLTDVDAIVTYTLTNGVSGTFTTVDNKTVTVTNGLITAIV
jgi:hypothetical protein